MKKTLAILLMAAVLLLCGASALADTDITAQGTAVVTAKPDIVSVTAAVNVTADSVLEAQAKISQIIADTTEKLLALGVLEDDIFTQNFYFYPVYNYDEDLQTVKGYQVIHSLNVTCRDILMLDSVINAMTDSGMSEIYGVDYDVSNRTELYQDALALAIDAAQEKAARMAKAANLTLTKVEGITENGGYSTTYNALYSADATASAARGEGTGIRAGDVSVSASVTVVYEAK